MLVPLNFAVWYGEGMAAAVINGFSPAVAAGIGGYARASASIVGGSSVPFAKPTRLVNSPALITASGSIVQALPKGRARAAATIRVNSLTQDDIAGAVWGTTATQYANPLTMGGKLNAAGGSGDPWSVTLEGTYTAADLIRIMVAVLAGNATDLNGANPAFKSLDGSKDRVTATQSAGDRTVTALDGS